MYFGQNMSSSCTFDLHVCPIYAPGQGIVFYIKVGRFGITMAEPGINTGLDEQNNGGMDSLSKKEARQQNDVMPRTGATVGKSDPLHQTTTSTLADTVWIRLGLQNR
jgi:hypothetical protein